MPPAVAHPRPYLALAVKPGGKRTLQVRSATSAANLASSLRKEKLTVLRSVALPKALASGDRKLGLKDHAILNDQLYQLVSRGVPLVEALEVVGNTVTSVARPVVRAMRDMVSSGTSLAESAQKTGQFDPVTIAVYRAAERSGDLAGAARQLAVSARRTLQVTQKAQSLLIYPVVLGIVAVVVSLTLLILVLPNLGETLIQNGIAIPGYTKVLLTLGTWMRGNLLIVIALVVCAAVAIFICRKALWAWLISLGQRLPVARDVMLAAESARFFAVMSAMSKAGVPLADGLATANQVISHPVLRKQLDKLRDRLISGGVLRNLIEDVDALPLATRRLLLAAERSGDMDTAFGSLAGDLTDEVERQATRLLAVLQPVLIILMTVVIGALLLAILVPVLSAAGNVA
ncbi:MAG TPA: type II secretion system F family protein [Phycisphaerales bacterium]|nr:type II secretion system F family protein [Phycisphaerales bacterium]